MPDEWLRGQYDKCKNCGDPQWRHFYSPYSIHLFCRNGTSHFVKEEKNGTRFEA